MSEDAAPRDAASDPQRERLVERRTVHQGRLLRLHEDSVELPGGSRASREIVEHRGAVGVVASTGDGVVLVRQWRHAAGSALWEICAGTRDADEEPLATARRELGEETGYTAARWSGLGSGLVSPGYSTERIWFFLAEELTAGDAANDADESLEVRTFGAGELVDLVRQGVTDLKTVAGLSLAGLMPPIHRAGR